jgi:DNA-binding MarR family transcriptional regulator
MTISPTVRPRRRVSRARRLDELLRRLDVSLLAIAHFYSEKTVSSYMDEELALEPYRSLFRALRVVRDTSPPVSIRDVQRALGISHPATSRLIDRCAAEGFLDRKEAVFDRRHATLTLTTAGARATEDVEAARRAVISKLVADWAEADIERLDNMLERLGGEIDQLKRDQSRSV